MDIEHLTHVPLAAEEWSQAAASARTRLRRHAMLQCDRLRFTILSHLQGYFILGPEDKLCLADPWQREVHSQTYFIAH